MCPKGLTHSGWEGVCLASPAGCMAACPASVSWVGVGISVHGDNQKRVPLLPRWGVAGQQSWDAVWLGQNNSSPQRALGRSPRRAEAPRATGMLTAAWHRAMLVGPLGQLKPSSGEPMVLTSHRAILA